MSHVRFVIQQRTISDCNLARVAADLESTARAIGKIEGKAAQHVVGIPFDDIPG